MLAVLNVINAIFVNDAMVSTRTDHGLRMESELEETKTVAGEVDGNLRQDAGDAQRGDLRHGLHRAGGRARMSRCSLLSLVCTLAMV